MRPELVPVQYLSARMRQLGAEYRPDKTVNKDRAHVYYMPATRRWIQAVRRNRDFVALTFHDTCPCALAQNSAR